jgi:putative membrane protein
MKHLFLGCVAVMGLTGCSTTAQAPPSSDLSVRDLNMLTESYQLIQFDLLECNEIATTPTNAITAAASDKLCADAKRYQPELEQLAQAHDVSLPNALPEEMEARYVTFHYNPSPSIAVQFLRDQVSSHEDALAVFRVEATNGDNPDIKAAAGRLIPVVQSNLDSLRLALGSQE